EQLPQGRPTICRLPHQGDDGQRQRHLPQSAAGRLRRDCIPRRQQRRQARSRCDRHPDRRLRRLQRRPRASVAALLGQGLFPAGRREQDHHRDHRILRHSAMRAIIPGMPNLQPAEELAFASPIPTQIVSSDEYLPAPQTPKQREVEARLKELASSLAKRHAMSRRRFFQTAAGMAASYLAMNEVYGPLFSVARAETTSPELADARADALKGQLIFDAHTHFIRDDPSPHVADPARTGGLMWQRTLAARTGWNKDLTGKPQSVDDLKFANFLKEIYLDSDTKVALLSNAPSDDPKDWLLPQEAVFKARERVNAEAGSKRLLAHFTVTPGQPGWLEAVDRAIEVHKPDGWKAYTIGDFIIAHGGRFAYKPDHQKARCTFFQKAGEGGGREGRFSKGGFPFVGLKDPRRVCRTPPGPRRRPGAG